MQRTANPEALTLADEDIKENWEGYRKEFLRRNKP